MSSETQKRVYFVSLGCPKNRVDSEVMLGALSKDGHQIVGAPEQAEVIVVNTCGFIDAAKEESIDTILEMAQYKKSADCQQLVVTGCLSQRYPTELASEIPEIDQMLGSADFQKLPAILGQQPSPAGAPAGSGRGPSLPVIQVSETPAYIYDHNSPRLLTGGTHSAYLKIAEGCDRPCGFCIIPKLRGPQRSRGIESIVAEAKDLVSRGAVEINLIAQDLTRYGVDREDKPTLAALLKELGKVEGIRWIRLHYTYPTAFSDELIEVIANEPRVAKYVDVPLQHIDDRMLKLMRRGHTARRSYELIERLRASVQDLVLRTTFIVGHPGETEEAFDKLCDFVREMEFDRVGVFTYSAEQGTSSAELEDELVPGDVAIERQERLMNIQREISRRKMLMMVGQEIEVLVDGISKESDLLLEGRWYGQAPEIDGNVVLTDGSAAKGTFVKARVVDASDYDLAASLARDESSTPASSLS